MDVKLVFFNGVLQKEIYIEQPTGYVIQEQKNKVYKLAFMGLTSTNGLVLRKTFIFQKKV